LKYLESKFDPNAGHGADIHNGHERYETSHLKRLTSKETSSSACARAFVTCQKRLEAFLQPVLLALEKV